MQSKKIINLVYKNGGNIMVKDPICGMKVDPKKAKFALEKDGKTYYFCSQDCYEVFKNKDLDKNQAEVISANKTEKCTIRIEGMSCGACAAKMEKNFKSQKGVNNVNVNLATGMASIEYEPQKISVSAFEKIVVDSGYTVKKPERLSILSLKVLGMDNPHCMGIVGSALDKLSGVVEKTLLPTEKAVIKYDPEILDSSRIREIIKDVGYENFLDTENKDEEREAREREIQSLKHKTGIAMILSLPLLYFAMGPHMGLPVSEFIEKNMGLIQYPYNACRI